MKRCFHLILLFSISVIITAKLYAQQNPPGINWKSIDTGTYEIIFPEEITPLGQRVANLMVHYEKYNYSNLSTEPRKIPIVLINNYADANGFVSPSPFYSHWFTTPSSFDSIEWFKGLAIHEGRHMVQMNKLTDGPGKGAWNLFFGDAGSAVFSGIYVPTWFFEGDAVVMETALTEEGRGRSPYFDLWQRGIELSGERYNYYKSYLGSYNAMYPYSDHYRLGYLLCSYIQKHYGKNVWDRVLSDTGRYSLFYTFDTALLHVTGKRIPDLYTDAMNEYRELWKEQQNGLHFTYAQDLTPGKLKTWESFLYPSISGPGNLTAVSYTGDHKLSLVKLKYDKEPEIITQVPFEIASSFLMNERILSSGGNYLLWRESVTDPRWGYKTFSDLKLLDITTGKSEFITGEKKFIASALSSDGKTAAGIEYGPELNYYLTIIDTKTGIVKQKDEMKDTGYLFDPALSPDGKEAAVVSLSDNGYALLIYNLETKKIRTVIDYTNDERLRAPVFFKKYLIYGSDYSGIDNIYAVDITGKKRYQVTSRSLGAYFPSVSDSTMYFNDYSFNGYKAASMMLDQKEWIPIEKVSKNSIDYIEPVADQMLGGDNNNIDNIPSKEYSVKDYNPILNSINIRGWIPYFDSTSTDFSLNLLSKDVLHTTDMSVSYIYNFNEKKNYGIASIVYSGLYPVITLDGGYGGRAVYLEDESSDDEAVFMTWNEVSGSAGLSVPLNFSRGIYYTYLNFGSDTGYIKIYNKSRDDYIFNNGMSEGDMNYIKYFISFTRLAQVAGNSVTPGVGTQLKVSYIHTPFYGDYRGSLFSSELVFYLPGFTDIQGLKLTGSYEKIRHQSYIFSQNFLFPRGYDSIRHDRLYKGSADYSFPVINFSANIWKLVYIKRIIGNIFYDLGAGKTDNHLIYYRSAGIELTAEQNLLSNKYFAIEAGLRYSRCIDTKENRYELVLKTPL